MCHLVKRLFLVSVFTVLLISPVQAQLVFSPDTLDFGEVHVDTLRRQVLSLTSEIVQEVSFSGLSAVVLRLLNLSKGAKRS